MTDQSGSKITCTCPLKVRVAAATKKIEALVGFTETRIEETLERQSEIEERLGGIEGALSSVCEEVRRQHERKPRRLNRPTRSLILAARYLLLGATISVVLLHMIPEALFALVK